MHKLAKGLTSGAITQSSKGVLSVSVVKCTGLAVSWEISISERTLHLL